MELVSVIVPVYNVERYLQRCMDSVLKQSYRNLEIILVDDGSPDNCPAMCEAFKLQDPRVKVIHKENGGLGFARNSGLDAATGTYITFIDSDDWISEDHIENLYQAAKTAGADVVIGAHTSVLADGVQQIHPIRLQEKVYKDVEITNEILLPLIGAEANHPQDVQFNSSSCMNLYRLDVIKSNELRFRSEKIAIAEDYFFNVDFFCCAKRAAVINEVGYFYFENINSISRKYDPKRFERTVNFYTTIQEQIVEYGLADKVEFRAERTFLMKVRVAIRHVVRSCLPFGEKQRQIRGFLSHSVVQEVLQKYPIDTLTPAMRLLTKWMRSGNVAGVYWLVKLRETVRGLVWVRKLLNQRGIGK